MDRRSFQAWAKQHLVPMLRLVNLVILDSLGSHKGKAVRRAIRQVGARLWFLPPYSPDLTPTKQAFAKVKHWMRDAQQCSVEDTWRQFGTLLATIEPRESEKYRLRLHVERTRSSYQLPISGKLLDQPGRIFEALSAVGCGHARSSVRPSPDIYILSMCAHLLDFLRLQGLHSI